MSGKARRARQARNAAFGKARLTPDHRGRCEASGKLRWRSRGDAEQARTNLAVEGGKAGRSYRCPHCGDWHVTRSA